MKVLVTGMASSHTKPSTNTTFFGTLVKAVETFADVEWATPSVTWTKDFLDQYDSVILGFLPPTSMSANKVYGAMHVLDLLYESPKLTLVVDNPQVWQFKSSLASLAKDGSSIFTPFYSRRREYKVANTPDMAQRVQSVSKKLLDSVWPKTIYPSLPWKNSEDLSKFISTNSPDSLIGVNLDSMLMSEPKPAPRYIPIWLADYPSSSWTKKTEKLLMMPVAPIKETSKDNDDQVFYRLASSFGLLVSPQERGVGTWWSYRHIQALNALVPVVSDWRDTGSLSNSWYILGSKIEESTPEERLTIAKSQREDYLNAIPSKSESIQLIKSILTTGK